MTVKPRAAPFALKPTGPRTKERKPENNTQTKRRPAATTTDTTRRQQNADEQTYTHAPKPQRALPEKQKASGGPAGLRFKSQKIKKRQKSNNTRCRVTPPMRPRRTEVMQWGPPAHCITSVLRGAKLTVNSPGKIIRHKKWGLTTGVPGLSSPERPVPLVLLTTAVTATERCRHPHYHQSGDTLLQNFASKTGGRTGG